MSVLFFVHFKRSIASITLSFFFLSFAQISFAAGPPPSPWADESEEIDLFHKPNASDAKSFYTDVMSPGVSVPTYTGGVVGYKAPSFTGDLESGVWESGSWVDESWDSFSSPTSDLDSFYTSGDRSDSANLDAAVDAVDDYGDDHVLLNTATGAAITGPVDMDSAYHVLHDKATDPTNTHPNIFNQSVTVPELGLVGVELWGQTRSTLDNVNAQGYYADCERVTETASETSLVHSPLYKTCRVIQPPSSCEISRHIVSIEEPFSCVDMDNLQDLNFWIFKGEDGGHHRGRVSVKCGGSSVSQVFQYQGWQDEKGTKVVDVQVNIPISGNPNWTPLMSTRVGYVGCDGGLGGADCGVVIEILAYRNHKCVESPLVDNNWQCSIEFATMRESSSGALLNTPNWYNPGSMIDNSPEPGIGVAAHVNWHVSMSYAAKHRIFKVNEATIDFPPGCSSASSICKAEPDPNYMPPATPTDLSYASSSSWECTEVDNNRTWAGIPINPNEPTLEGIYYPSQPVGGGPDPLVGGTDPSVVCWSATARNYQCLSSYGDIQEDPSGCDELQSSCAYVDEVPYEVGGIAMGVERTYDCGGFNKQLDSLATSSETSCATNLRCVGTECFDGRAEESNEDFGAVAAQTSLLGWGKDEINCQSLDDCYIWEGNLIGCTNSVDSQNCCTGGPTTSMELGMDAFDIAKNLNAQMDISTKALNAFEAGANSLATSVTNTGAWQWIANGWTSASGSVSGAIADLGFSNVANYASEFLAMGGSVSSQVGTALSMETISNFVITKVYEYVYDYLGPQVATSIFATTTGAGASAAITPTGGFSPLISSTFNVLAWGYLAYQVINLALAFAFACEDEDFMYQERYSQESCTMQARWTTCDKDIGGVCVVDKHSRCCYDSLLGRIVQEQARKQAPVRAAIMSRENKLGVFPILSEENPFGSYGSGWNGPDCSGLTPADMDIIDWDLVDLRDWLNKLTTTGRLPDGAAAANAMFGRDELTKSTFLRQEKLDEVAARQAADKAKAETELANLDAEEVIINDKIANYELRISSLEDDIAVLSATPTATNLALIDEKNVLIGKLNGYIEYENTNLIKLNAKRVSLTEFIANFHIAEGQTLQNPTTIDRNAERMGVTVDYEARRSELRNDAWSGTVPLRGTLSPP